MTARARFAARVRAPLTQLESEVMQAVWAEPVTSAEPVQDSMQPLLRGHGSEWAFAFTAIYLLGALVLLIRIGIGSVRVGALLGADGLMRVGGDVGWLRPKVILPPEWRQWPQARLEAVLAHEREHSAAGILSGDSSRW